MANSTNKRSTDTSSGTKGVIAGLEARRVCAMLLQRTLDDKRAFDSLIDARHGLKPYLDLEENDRALVRAIVTTVFRRKGELSFALSKLWDRPPPKNARFLNHMLLIAAAQILLLDIPDSAAVNTAVSAIAADKNSARFKNFANAVLRRMVREKDGLTVSLQSGDHVNANLPPFLFKRLRQSYGKAKAQAIVASHRNAPSLDLTIKEGADTWAEQLGGIVLPTGCVRLVPAGPVPEMPGFSEGAWWVQDVAATLPARLIISAMNGDVSGKRIADLCAAPGGKTAQLAHAGADVTAVDISANRLARLAQNLERLKLGANLVETDLLEWEPEASFDAILLDAPCSSTGTIRRHPDVAWLKSAEDIEVLAQLQEKLWRRAIDWLKPGGILVFSNCSLDRSEGEDIYARLLNEKLPVEPMPVTAQEVGGLSEVVTGQGTVRTLPSMLPNENPRLAGMDGFFAARMRRV